MEAQDSNIMHIDEGCVTQNMYGLTAWPKHLSPSYNNYFIFSEKRHKTSCHHLKHIHIQHIGGIRRRANWTGRRDCSKISSLTSPGSRVWCLTCGRVATPTIHCHTVAHRAIQTILLRLVLDEEETSMENIGTRSGVVGKVGGRDSRDANIKLSPLLNT